MVSRTYTPGKHSAKTLDQPDETRPLEKGKVEILNLDVGTVMRASFEPGLRWSECVKPIVGGESCQVDQFGYCVSRRLHVGTDDGEEFDVGPGDASRIPPGHDAWGRRRRALLWQCRAGFQRVRNRLLRYCLRVRYARAWRAGKTGRREVRTP